MSAGMLLGLAGIVLSFFAPDQYKKWFLLSGVITLLLAMGGKAYLRNALSHSRLLQPEYSQTQPAPGAY